MFLEFLLEEPSAEAALRVLVPKIVGDTVSFDCRVFQGKLDLLGRLPGRLNGYRHWLPKVEPTCIVVLVDRDDERDCRLLKARLEDTARQASLVTLSSARGTERVQVINRLAVEELEAWFFGDVPALVSAFPGVSADLANQRRYRDPDAIRGGTWEALERVLQQAGYYGAGLPKIEVAQRVAQHMEPERNRSRSFRVFRDALRKVATDS